MVFWKAIFTFLFRISWRRFAASSLTSATEKKDCKEGENPKANNAEILI